MGDELGHGLLGDLGPAGQLADPRALGVEVLEDVPVRGSDLGMAALGDPNVELLVAEPIRLAQEQAEVRRPGGVVAGDA